MVEGEEQIGEWHDVFVVAVNGNDGNINTCGKLYLIESVNRLDYKPNEDIKIHKSYVDINCSTTFRYSDDILLSIFVKKGNWRCYMLNEPIKYYPRHLVLLKKHVEDANIQYVAGKSKFGGDGEIRMD